MSNSEEICIRLKLLLRDIVVLQDYGKMDSRILNREGYELSFIDRLMNAAHIERLKMVQEGIDVYVPPGPDMIFTIGLEPWPYKKSE